MRKKKWKWLGIGSGILLLFFLSDLMSEIKLSEKQATEIGKKIWKNECGGTVEGLTSWNKGEEFASLGIGHFIWYPSNYQGPFEESFPKLILYLESKGKKIPDWLKGECPWNSREAFLKDFSSPRMKALRQLLVDTISFQTQFAANRLKGALPKILKNLPEEEQARIRMQFDRVASHPHGVYVLMDYVNFKGEGIKEEERYAGKGWGLLQVLSEMKGTKSSTGKEALDEFADAAIFVLERRVKNSPPERKEKRWMRGWTNRCHSYRLNKEK